MNEIKIILACHKPCYIIEKSGYIPVQAGKKIANFSLDCVGDDETGLPDGEISAKNKSLNEMTVVYWAWKNYDSIGNPDYIGFGHYRRLFIFDRTLPRTTERWLKKSRTFVFPDYKSILPYIDIKKAEALLAKYDILAPEKYDANNLNNGTHYKNCKERFYDIGDFNPDLYNMMEEFVLESHPDYLLEIEELRAMPEHYICNMFVMKKEDFFRYCEFIFPVLFRLEKANECEKRKKEKRALGFLAEFLTSMFISHCKRVEGKKVKELDLLFVDYTEKFEWKLGIKKVIIYVCAFVLCVLTFGKRGRYRMGVIRQRCKQKSELKDFWKEGGIDESA